MLMYLLGAIWGIGMGMGLMSLVDWWIDRKDAGEDEQ